MYRALLVCNSTYPEDPASLPDLDGPRRDGLVLWRALVDERIGLFSIPSTSVLFERTAREIAVAAEEFFDEASEQDILLFYFSGHGKRAGGDLYLAARDTRADSLLATSVSTESLSKMMTVSMASAIIVVLDCCHAGAFKGDSFGKELAGEGRFVLAACKGVDLARDSGSKLDPSPFTAAIVEGLLGGAADENRDGLIDVEELERYVSKKLRRTGPAPFKSFDGSGSPVLARADLLSTVPAVDPPSSSSSSSAAENQEILTTHIESLTSRRHEPSSSAA